MKKATPPNRKVNCPRFFREQFALADSITISLGQYEVAIEMMLDKTSPTGRQQLRKFVESKTGTNCSWHVYRSAKLIKEILDRLDMWEKKRG